MFLFKKNTELCGMNALQLLETQHLKRTQVRTNVLDLFLSKPHALSQPDVEIALAKQFDRITVYRTLRTFEEKGLIHKVIDLQGTTRFALCSQECHDDDSHAHHDAHIHFHCTICEQVYCGSQPPDLKITMPPGFEMHDFQVQVTGICKFCRVMSYEL